MPPTVLEIGRSRGRTPRLPSVVACAPTFLVESARISSTVIADRKKYNTMRRTLSALAAAVLLVLTASAARSDEIDDATALLRKGDASQALIKVDGYLKDHPQDARGRFLKGAILADQHKTDEAIAVLRALNEEMPELPEPYNNLAVLYAAKGDYAAARRALETAILAHPGYALAHENLGDLYARMAAQSYERAQKLDPKNSSVPAKLKLIDQLLKPAQK
jgi:Flp pilus assembly protein TadD